MSRFDNTYVNTLDCDGVSVCETSPLDADLSLRCSPGTEWTKFHERAGDGMALEKCIPVGFLGAHAMVILREFFSRESQPRRRGQWLQGSDDASVSQCKARGRRDTGTSEYSSTFP